MKKAIAVGLAALACLTVAGCGGSGATEVTVDFGEKTAVQNLKKFDLFTSDWVWKDVGLATYDANMESIIPAMSEMKSQTLRLDLGIGSTYRGLGYNIGRGGNDGSTDAEYDAILKLASALKKGGVQPYLSVAYTPDFALPEGDTSWKGVPVPEKWEQFNANLVKTMLRNGVHPIYEQYNEPDFNAFFSGSWEDYTETYLAGYRGIKSVDPDAVVAGMSAYGMNRRATQKKTYRIDGERKEMTDLGYFIERTYDEALADAFSWHYYGAQGEIEDIGDNSFSAYLDGYREVLNEYVATGQYPKLETVQTHLNEFNVYHPGTTDKYMRSEIVPYMFRAMQDILAAPDITNINWAAIVGEKQDSSLSYEFINGLSFERYPAYYAVWMFGRLPVDGKQTVTKDEDLITFAGADAGRAGCIICNGSGEARTVKISLKDIPFRRANAALYVADDTHKTYTTSNVPYLLAKDENLLTDKGLEIQVELEPYASVYAELNNADGTPTDTDVMRQLGSYVRTDYWYPARENNAPFANVHVNSLSAYLGMDGCDEGESCASILFRDAKGERFKMAYDATGAEAAGDATLGFRIDYEMADGKWGNSVLYAFRGFDGKMAIPFGTERSASLGRSLGSALKGSVDIALDELAPADWTGGVRISYLIRNCKKGTAAKFLIR